MASHQCWWPQRWPVLRGLASHMIYCRSPRLVAEAKKKIKHRKELEIDCLQSVVVVSVCVICIYLAIDNIDGHRVVAIHFHRQMCHIHTDVIRVGLIVVAILVHPRLLLRHGIADLLRR